MSEPMMYLYPPVFVCSKGHETKSGGIHLEGRDSTSAACLFCLRDWMLEQGWEAQMKPRPNLTDTETLKAAAKKKLQEG